VKDEIQRAARGYYERDLPLHRSMFLNHIEDTKGFWDQHGLSDDSTREQVLQDLRASLTDLDTEIDILADQYVAALTARLPRRSARLQSVTHLRTLDRGKERGRLLRDTRRERQLVCDISYKRGHRYSPSWTSSDVLSSTRDTIKLTCLCAKGWRPNRRSRRGGPCARVVGALAAPRKASSEMLVRSSPRP